MRFVDISPDGYQWLALKLDVNDESHRGTLWDHASSRWRSPPPYQRPLDRRELLAGRNIHCLCRAPFRRCDGRGRREPSEWKSSIAFDDAPRFSPDSKILRATLDNNGQTKNVDFAIWEVGVDGKNPHPLDFGLKPGSSAYHGMWTPDGKHFVFLGGERISPPSCSRASIRGLGNSGKSVLQSESRRKKST